MSVPGKLSLFEDPVTLEVVWRRLVTVADEMQTALRRTAFSTIVGAANDLGCDLLDARGRLVAHAVTSNPSFNLTLPSLVQKLLQIMPASSLRPGDVLITNDPWLVVGHLPDFAVVTPCFRGSRLVGFSASIAHVADIGGLLNPSFARSIFEEGLQIPPLKFYEAGTRNESIVSIIKRNVRLPEMVLGDLSALVTANAVGARQMLALLDEYSLESLDLLSSAIQTRAERAMRRAIREIPDGDYPYEVTFDELDGPMTIGVVLRIHDTNLAVDYVTVPTEHPYGGINTTFNYTLARSTYTLNCLLTPQVPSNDGLFRPITVQVPEGSVLNCRYPVSVSERTKVGWHITPVIQGALARALPGRVPAAGGFVSIYRLLGTDDRGVPFSSFLFNGGGLGAGPDVDGQSAIVYPTTSSNVPTEILEATSSIQVYEQDFLPDSGGAGQSRGGSGLRVTIGLPAHLGRGVTLGALLAHQAVPPQGVAGGGSGTISRLFLDGELLAIQDVRQRVGALALTDPGVRLSMETPGGGGYGDPRQRDPLRVLRDVRDGLVTVGSAERDYGVRVDLDHLTAYRPDANLPGSFHPEHDLEALHDRT